MHAEQAIAALERGIHVFCHQPPGRTARKTILLQQRGFAPIVMESTAYHFRAGIMATCEFLPRQLSESSSTFVLCHVECMNFRNCGADKKATAR
jgi:hypothetical protein